MGSPPPVPRDSQLSHPRAFQASCCSQLPCRPLMRASSAGPAATHTLRIRLLAVPAPLTACTSHRMHLSPHAPLTACTSHRMHLSPHAPLTACTSHRMRPPPLLRSVYILSGDDPSTVAAAAVQAGVGALSVPWHVWMTGYPG